MSGIYLHIPFCKQSCHYCDFHFSTTFHGYRERMILAMCKEIELQKNFLNDKIQTIYFGGGTPSLLNKNELVQIFKALRATFDISDIKEITLEANPDDLTEAYLRDLKEVGINRLSIGIQSFHEEDLRYMNRAHNAQQAIQSVKWAKEIGITNLSIDLIYGFPNLSEEKWLNNMKTAIDLGVQHISSYSMTVENGTALSKFIEKGKVPAVNDEQSALHFQMLQNTLIENGFEHYEISNFCLPNFESKHNSSYWLQKKYLGIGPSAHSYDGHNRYWNVSNNMKYILSLELNTLANEKEEINENTAYNEYILTRLRTKWGVEEKEIEQFSQEIQDAFYKNLKEHLDAKNVIQEKGIFTLSAKGKLLADRIASDLFVV
ncbi:MAG: radical SAM family heme chaperone HemW [Flavobacteriales bacterium]